MLLKRLVAIALLLVSTSALAGETATKIWDVPFGTSVAALGAEFGDSACGTDGGPRGTVLKSFSDFAACPPDASGLHEIWFRYDDEQEYIALAYRTPVAALQNRLTAINGQRAILSFLVDDSGLVQGFRIFTDPKAPERERYDAHIVSGTLRALMGKDWTCEDLPPAAGEEPIEGIFVKTRCSFSGKGRTARLTTDFYLRPGQQVLDSNAKRMVNSFSSAASLDVRADPQVAALPMPPAPPSIAGTTLAERFLAGESKDCPGCDLAGADLRGRDLSGANLADADLSNAILHRAVLRNTNFAGAKLVHANLNATDLTLSDFAGANLTGALLYLARGARPNFHAADLSDVRAGEMELRQADFSGAAVTNADFGDAHLNEADFSGADLSGSYFYQASLIRARLAGAKAKGSNFTEADLRRADLTGGTFADSDFQKAVLQEADLSGADFTHVRLARANLRDAKTDGANFARAIMPTGN
jgi:uncharacterized protein YjbI with pentapeptide repeats